MPDIKIRQTMGAIGIEVQKAKVEIQQNRPSFTMKSKPAKFRVNKRLPRFRFIQNEHLMASGYKTSIALSALKFAKARQKTLEAIGRISSEGDALMKIEKKGSPIADIAINNSEENVDLTVGTVQKNAIEWDVGYINIEWSPHQLEFNWNVQSRPKIVVHPHSVKIYMRRKPSIEIIADSAHRLYNKSSGRSAGRKIDKKV